VHHSVPYIVIPRSERQPAKEALFVGEIFGVFGEFWEFRDCGRERLLRFRLPTRITTTIEIVSARRILSEFIV
jgi:hypothetical protein